MRTLGRLAPLVAAALGSGCASSPGPTGVQDPAAAAAAPTASGAQAEPPADAIRGADPAVLGEIEAALEGAGSSCEMSAEEKGVLVCDRERQGVPALALTYQQPVLYVLAHFLRKPEQSCESIIPKLNELNAKVDALKVVCVDDRVSFLSQVLVPTYGLSPADVAQHVDRFRQAVQLVLTAGGLVNVLQ